MVDPSNEMQGRRSVCRHLAWYDRISETRARISGRDWTAWRPAFPRISERSV